MSQSRYRAHEPLVAPVRAYAELWRLGLGLLVVAIVSLGGTQVLFALLAGIVPGLVEVGFGTNPIEMLVILFSFEFISLGVMMAAQLLQRRDIISITGPVKRAWCQFRQVLWYLSVVMVGIALLPPYGMGAPLVPHMSVWLWAGLLPLSLLAVLTQVAAEEILFRGYVQQTLAARFRHPLIWMGLPSLVFAWAHYMPEDAGDNALLLAIWAGLFAVLMADLTARAGSLGPAIAVHLVNNVIALLIIGAPGSLNGLALFLMPYELSDLQNIRPWLWVDMGLIVVSWLTARLAIRA